MTPNEAARHGLDLRRTGSGARRLICCRIRTSASTELARIWPRFAELDRKVAGQLEIDAKYAVYLSRQAADVESYRRDEGLVLPEDIDYVALPGLSNEVRHKLQTHPSAHHRTRRPASME